MRCGDGEAGVNHALTVAHRYGNADNARKEFLIVDRVAALADLLQLAMQRFGIRDGVFSVARKRGCADQLVPPPAWLHAEQELADRGAMQGHARPWLELQPERPGCLNAIDVDNGIAGH